MSDKKGRILKPCTLVAEKERMIWVCDGAANVGQVGHRVGVLLTNLGKGRLCCITAIAAGSKSHIEIAKKAKMNIAINGCANMCVSKVLREHGARIDLEIDISKYLKKVPTLDIYEGDVKKIADEIIKIGGL